MLECKRCGNKWESRIKKTPKQCPKCKSPYWNQKRLSRKEIEKMIKARVENSKMNMESICKVLDSAGEQAGVKWFHNDSTDTKLSKDAWEFAKAHLEGAGNEELKYLIKMATEILQERENKHGSK